MDEPGVAGFDKKIVAEWDGQKDYANSRPSPSIERGDHNGNCEKKKRAVVSQDGVER